MSFRSIVRDVRDSIGSLSRRRSEGKFSHHDRRNCQSAVFEGEFQASLIRQSPWANLPPELLRDVIQRLEASEGNWPARKNVVACAAVCKSWREMCKEIVKTPEQSGKLTFPISLKQPGPRDAPILCFIKRDRSNSTYHLYMGLGPALSVENGKFLLAAKKVRRATSTEYIISMDAEEMSRSSSTYVGKLRSNFLGTKFTIHDSQPPYSGAASSSGRSSKRFYSKKVSPRVPCGNYNIANIAYELNVLGTRGPRRMQCIMHSIPVSAIEAGGSVPTPSEFSNSLEDSFSSLSFRKTADELMDFSSTSLSEIHVGPIQTKDGPLVLKNKAPRWHEQLQCWCLNFKGRVTVASVKNFQLVAATEPSQPVMQSDHDKVILQFGKIGKDIFTMDYRYPLSVFQSFAICLSSFDTKLACE
uniref:TSA: Wollemia nobilis Ref_Wollemi_Transcript_15460_2385 transcribed RNA sequence n=1 Tax=Wollemia nobilis TaxID=56998 RepID=A0A0C9S395_9CONI